MSHFQSRLMRQLISTSLPVLAFAIASQASAQTISGKVTDSTGNAPFEGVVVSVDDLNRATTSDRYGNYKLFNIPPGSYTVTSSYIGARTVRNTVEVTKDGTVLDIIVGDNVDYIDNIIVVGTRAAQAGALNQQRAADSILTVIDSDGLGNFPDTTVADSLSRAVGLSIETDQGEGRYVSIRGINTDLISSSINGVRTPSPEDRRGVLLDGVPSDLLDGIEIQKSLTPDVDADSLGGVINLKTISAFDRGGVYFRAKAEGRYNEISDTISPKGTLTYSNVFGDQLGVAVSANYQDLDIESHNNETGAWGFDEDAGEFFLNDDYEQRWYDIDRERIGLVANFDLDVNENTRLYLRTLFNNYADDEVRNKFEYKDLDDGMATSQSSSTVPINEVDTEMRKRKEVRQIQTYALGGTTGIDTWTFEYEGAYAYAEEDDSDNHDVAFRYEDIQDNNVGDLIFDTSNPQQPFLSGSEALGSIFTPSNYFLASFEEENSINQDTELSAKLDVSKESLFGNTQVTWKAGAKIRDREKIRDVNLDIYSGAEDINLSGFVENEFIDNWRLANPMPAYPDGDLTASLRGNAQGNLEFEDDDSNFGSLSEDFEVNEQILAAYGMGTFRVGNATIVAGARVEQTKIDMTGNNYAEEADINDVTVLNFENDYTNFLPSLNVKYDFTDKLVGRAAYYAAVVRPGFGDMAPFARLNDDEDEAEIGNPSLQPYEADNFDLALEFYPSSLSIMSIGGFYKTIDNAIYQATFDVGNEPGQIDLSSLNAAQLLTVEEITTSINVDTVDLYGVEFNFVQDLNAISEALDGFLISANLTLTESEATIPDGEGFRNVPFLKQSDSVWNVALAYDKGPWDLRVSANYRGDYLDELTSEGDPGDPEYGSLDRYTDGRLMVEASAKYKVTDSLQIYLEGKNLTDEPEYYYFGDESRLSQYDEFGTSVNLGARFTY
ncbi:TonB-dependent receptor [Litorimonas haliclonae]|uniref:TonB-dependent receptor n=1 Tax=Litorimonas haliclonae TaxID=2081977 RepID=UPI0039F00746